MDQYAIYLRKSRADADAEARGDGETLARHERILLELAQRNRQPIAQIYREIVSGETIADRPQMQRLLSEVGQRAYAGVLVVDIERLARGDTMDQGLVAQAFKYSNTRIITPAKVYDPQNEFDEEFFEFALFMSRREYKTINRRIQAGRMQSVREGNYIGSRPAYGYRKVKVPDGKGYTLAVCEEEAKVVRQIFDWYIHGDGDGGRMGLVRIAGRLEDLRVPPGAHGGGWKPCRVHRILSNEVYIGKIRWGAVRTQRAFTPHGIEKKQTQMRDYALHDGKHAPIIDGDTFLLARAVASGHRNVPVRRDHELSNPLVGLLRCKACGRFLRALPASGRQPAQVFCATRGCPTVRTYREPVERLILDTLYAWLDGFQLDAGTPEPPVHADTLEDDAIDRLTETLSVLDRQKGSLHDLLEQGVYSMEVFAERRALLDQRLEEAERALARLRAGKKPRRAAMAEILPDIRHVLDAYHVAATAREKNGLLRLVLSKVVYEKSIRGKRGVPADQFRLIIYPRIRR